MKTRLLTALASYTAIEAKLGRKDRETSQEWMTRVCSYLRGDITSTDQAILIKNSRRFEALTDFLFTNLRDIAKAEGESEVVELLTGGVKKFSAGRMNTMFPIVGAFNLAFRPGTYGAAAINTIESLFALSSMVCFYAASGRFPTEINIDELDKLPDREKQRIQEKWEELTQQPKPRLLLTEYDNPEEVEKYKDVKTAPWSLEKKCNALAPVRDRFGKEVRCNRLKGHEGPHVEKVALVGQVNVVWED